VDVTFVKSLRPSYTGLYPQKRSVDTTQVASPFREDRNLADEARNLMTQPRQTSTFISRLEKIGSCRAQALVKKTLLVTFFHVFETTFFRAHGRYSLLKRMSTFDDIYFRTLRFSSCLAPGVLPVRLWTHILISENEF